MLTPSNSYSKYKVTLDHSIDQFPKIISVSVIMRMKSNICFNFISGFFVSVDMLGN